MMKHLFALLFIISVNNLIYAQGEHIQAEQKQGKSGVRKLRELIQPGDIKHAGGYGYIVTLRLARIGDKHGNSQCVLLEDGKPLSQPRSIHKGIGRLGRGRYSHWTKTSLYFSASDSSDPRTNGRRYELVSDERFVRKSAKVTATSKQSRFQINADENVRVRMLRLKLTNLDGQLFVIPHLKHSSDPDLTSIASMLKSVTDAGMSDEQKCFAIWKLLVDWRYHDYPAEGGAEIHDPVKFLNVYGYGFCDDSAATFCELTKAAGIKSRIHGLSGHVVAEAYYNGGWHMFDPDHEVVYHTRDGKVASVGDLERQPQIITATPTDPIGSRSQDIANLYTSTQDNHSANPVTKKSLPLHPVLGPGDQVVFDFTSRERIHRRLFRSTRLPPSFGNGALLQKRKTADMMRVDNDRLLEIRWPYVVLGGKLKIPDGVDISKIIIAISRDRKQWTPLEFTKSEGKLTASFNSWIDQQPSATYNFWIRFRSVDKNGGDDIDPSLICDRITIQTDFQFAPLAHAPVKSGMNEYELTVNPIENQSLNAWSGLDVELEWEELPQRRFVGNK